jgi:hypothetical protein
MIVLVQWDGHRNSLAKIRERGKQKAKKQGLSDMQKFAMAKQQEAWWWAERNVMGYYDLMHIVDQPREWW